MTAADIRLLLVIVALTALAVLAVDKEHFVNNWRVVPCKLTDTMIPPEAKPTAAKLKLNKHQVAAVRKSLKITDDKVKITDTVLKAEQLKTLYLDPRQLDLIGLKTLEQRKAAGIVDAKSLRILGVDAKELGKVVVKELELVIFPNEDPPHYGVIVTPVSDFLPKIFTDFGHADRENPDVDRNTYRFITMGKEKKLVVAHVKKIIPIEKTIDDFDKRTFRDTVMNDKYGLWNCLSYAGQWLLYSLGQCGLTKADMAALKPKKADEERPQDPCKERSNKDAADFMKTQKTSGLFAVGDGWKVNDFAERVGEHYQVELQPLDPEDTHFDFTASGNPCPK